MKKSVLFLAMLAAGFQNSIVSMSSLFTAMKNQPVFAAYVIGSFVVPAVGKLRNKAYDKNIVSNEWERKELGKMYKDTKEYLTGLPGKYAEFPGFINKSVSYSNLATVWFGVYLTAALNGNAKPSIADIKNFVTGSRAGQVLAGVTLFRILFDFSSGAYGIWNRNANDSSKVKKEENKNNNKNNDTKILSSKTTVGAN